MSGGDDFRTQYRDWGMGEPERSEPEESPKDIILRLVRQHGPRRVELWLESAETQYRVDQKKRQEAERKEEIARLKKVAEAGDKAKAQIRKLEGE